MMHEHTKAQVVVVQSAKEEKKKLRILSPLFQFFDLYLCIKSISLHTDKLTDWSRILKILLRIILVI